MTANAKTLAEARGLVAGRDGWCQGYFAKTVSGRLVDYNHREAVAFCGEGAVRRCGGGIPELIALARAVECRDFDFWKWHDRRGRTQCDVVVAFDRAIDQASRSK